MKPRPLTQNMIAWINHFAHWGGLAGEYGVDRTVFKALVRRGVLLPAPDEGPGVWRLYDAPAGAPLC